MTHPVEQKKKTDLQKSFEKAEWGSFLGLLPDDLEKNSNLCLFGDGQWLLRKNPIGVFCRKYNDHGIPGQDDGPEPFFKFNLPRIPLTILKQQVSFYRQVMKRHQGAEAYSIVMYDTLEKRYFLVVPKQRISGTSVSYAQDELRREYPSGRYLEVISAHSHNSMPAFFSGVDDADEKGDLIYMVMGTLDKPVPTFKIRANVAGSQCCFLGLSDIFDTNPEQWHLLSPGWTKDHNPAWMEMLNVSADYRSPHQNHKTTTSRKPGFVSSLNPNFTYYTRGVPSTSQIHRSYKGQLDFDNYLNAWGYGAEQELDEDAVNLRRIATSFAEDAISLSPSFAISQMLDALIARGYAKELQKAIALTAFAFGEVENSDWLSFPSLLEDDAEEEDLSSYFQDLETRDEDFIDNLYTFKTED